jgi:hypothetical protein
MFTAHNLKRGKNEKNLTSKNARSRIKHKVKCDYFAHSDPPPPRAAFLCVIRDFPLPLALALSAWIGILPLTYPS